MAEKRDQIFKAVMSIISNDYAGMPEKAILNETKQWVTAFGQAWKDKKLDDKLFTQYLQQYLAALHDPNVHLSLSPSCPYQPEQCGFSVRRWGNELYITEVREDTRMMPGDSIILLNQSTPDTHLSYMIGNPVNGDNTDRQLWDDIVVRCKHILIRHTNGATEDIPIKRFPKNPTQTPPQPANTDSIESHSDAIIIDLRKVGMTLDDAFYEQILSTIFSETVNIGDLMGDEALYTNYSLDNCRLRRMQLEALLSQLPQGYHTWINEEIERVSAHTNAGYVKETVREDRIIKGNNSGNAVILLTDIYTGSAGERIVQIAQAAHTQGSARVKIVGRSTSGAIDYSNFLAPVFDEFYSLVYPMTKTEAAYQGDGVSGKGLMPDIEVPFTPAECTEDLVKKTALSLI